MIGIPAIKNLQTPQMVPQPVGWTWDLPFNIYRSGTSFTTDFDIRSYAFLGTGSAYYVSVSGSDSNVGTSSLAPLRSVKTALAKSNVSVIYIQSGEYGYRLGIGSSVIQKNISLIPYDGRVSFDCREENALTWTLQSLTESINLVYKCARSGASGFIDARVTSSDGGPLRLFQQNNTASVQATASSWYTDGPNIYLRLSDDSQPTSSTVPLFVTNFRVSGNVTFYAENLDIWNAIAIDTPSIGNTPTCYMRNCTFRRSTGNAFGVSGGNTYLVDCIVPSGSGADGYNYHAGNSSSCRSVEINCSSTYCGVGSTDNCSSTHESNSIVRINGQYNNSNTRPIHDIQSAQSWNLGCFAHSPRTTNIGNFVAGLSDGQSTKMWLDNCQSSGSTYDIQCFSGSYVYIKRFQGTSTNNGNGTISSY